MEEALSLALCQSPWNIVVVFGHLDNSRFLNFWSFGVQQFSFFVTWITTVRHPLVELGQSTHI